MRKTYKKSMNKSMENLPGRCCDATMKGIHMWYAEMFEKLGWMVLAKSRGMTDKIQVYKNSLLRLKMAIEQKKNTIQDMDKKTDLGIMLDNVNTLMLHVEKDFA